MLTAPAAAEGPARAAFDRGVQAVQAGDFEDAIAAFERARARGLDTPALHYNLGVAYYRAGRTEDAAQAFRAAVERDGMVAPAAYNLGRIAAERGDTEAARRWFELAVERAQTAEIRERARRRLRGEADEADVDGSLSAGVGYDSNVTAAPDDLPEVSAAGDAFAEANAYARRALGDRAHLDAQVYVQRFDDETAFDITSLRVGGGHRWALDAQRRVRASAHVRSLRVGGDAFEDRLSAGADYERPLGDGLRARLAGEASWRRGRGDFDFLDGGGLTLEAGLQPAEQDRWALELAYSRIDRADSASATAFRSFSWHGLELSGRWRQPLPGARTLTVSGAWRHRHFDDPERRNGSTLGRRDANRARLTIALSQRWGERWSARGEAEFERRDAELERFDYTRERVIIDLTYAF